MSGLSEKQY